MNLCVNVNVGCEHLLRAVKRAKPLLHCFGHIHETRGAQVVSWNDDGNGLEKAEVSQEQEINLGIEHGKETLMINASISDENHQPKNAPFVITLALPVREN